MIRLSTTCRLNVRRFFSGLTILSVTFTQVVPAWALRPEGVGNPGTKAGIEEKLRGEDGNPVGGEIPGLLSAQRLVRHFQQRRPLFASSIVPGEVPPPEYVAAAWWAIRQLSNEQRTLENQVITALKILISFKDPNTSSHFNEQTVRSQISEVTQHPPGNCPTCAAHGLVNMITDPLHQAPESEALRDAQMFTALLIAMDVWLTNSVQKIKESSTGHEVFANSLAAVQLVYRAAEIGLRPAELHRDWLVQVMTPAQLKEAIKQGVVLVHIGGDHYSRILDADAKTVMYEMPKTTDGVVSFEPVVESWGVFLLKWLGTSKQGYALIGLRAGEHGIPGRAISENEKKAILGCCGVSFASGLHGLFSRAAASQAIVRVLESRGFDNFAAARRYTLLLPANFKLQSPRNAALRAKLEEVKKEGGMGILYLPADQQGPARLRFFGISRGVGSSTANSDIINRQIAEQVLSIAQMVYGPQVSIRLSSHTGDWRVMDRNIYRVGDVIEDGAADHTRFKTKGGDQEENAHHRPWKGLSLGFNGDWEDFLPAKAIQSMVLKQPFYGTSDYEPLEHLIGDMQENKDASGRVISYVPSHVAIKRAFRFMENMDALLRAHEIIQPDYVKDNVTESEQQAVILKLQELGIDLNRLRAVIEIDFEDEKVPVPQLVYDKFLEVFKNPALMDSLASAGNGWTGYYRHLGKQLPQTHDDRFDNPKLLNISINLLSLHDSHSAVVARTFDKATDFYFGFGRDPQSGEVNQILGGSEIRGFAALIGRENQRFPIREGIVDLVNGEVEQMKADPWSVYTVNKMGTKVTRHGVWDDSEEEFDQGNTMRVKWTQVLPGKERENAEWTRFRLETGAQPITLNLTLNALTQATATGEVAVRLVEATDRDTPSAQKLRTALSNSETKIYAAGSGTSMHALLLVNQMYGFADAVKSSDEWISALPRNLIQKELAAGRPPIFVIVSQSGTTGAAKALALTLIEMGAIVIGVTNRPGSSLYQISKETGGVVVTESIDEESVAATGSNTSQVGALEIVAMKREEQLASKDDVRLRDIRRKNSQRIQQLIGLTNYFAPGGKLHRGRLQNVLESFNDGQPNARVIDAVVDFMRSAGAEEIFSDLTAFRGTNFILTAMGPIASGIAPETSLKVMEVTRKLATFVPIQQLLAYGISGKEPAQPAQGWNPEAAIRSVEANLKAYTTGRPDMLGSFPYFPRFARNDPRLRDTSEVILLGDGEDLVALDYLASKYQVFSPVPVKRNLYASASERVREKALIIAVQPWTIEQAILLEKYRRLGANVVVVASKKRHLEVGVSTSAERSGTLLEVQGDEPLLGQVIPLDLFMMRIMEAKQVHYETYDYTKGSYLAEQIGKLQVQINGMREVSESFNPAPPKGAQRHRNAVSAERLKNHVKARGWNFFDWWATGKGVRYPAARDLALMVSAATGKMMEAAELSEFKHGRNAATGYGDVFFNVWSPQGTPDWGDDRKTAIDEEVPRLANYPYPIFSNQHPGMIVLIAAENPKDPYLVQLEKGEYEKLRSLRRQGGDVPGTRRPDIVFITPHGGFLEYLTLNRFLAQRMGEALSESIREKTGNWKDVVPKNLIINIDANESFEGKEGLYRALREAFSEEHNRILTLAPAGSALANHYSDHLLVVNSSEPIEFLLAGHQLTTRLVHSRFGKVLEYLVRLSTDLGDEIAKGPNGVFGGLAPAYRTPGTLIYAYALKDPDTTRALRDFVRERNNTYEDLELRLREILDWYNLNPFKEVKAAKNLPELNHAVVDLIDKLAKVVTNFSGIRVGGPPSGPFTLGATTLGAKEFQQVDQQAIASNIEAAAELAGIVRDVLGDKALSEDAAPAAAVDLFFQLAGKNLAEVLPSMRTQFQQLPDGMPIVVNLFGERLAHQADGRVYVNAHAFRHPLLLKLQLEHELGHEVLAKAAISVPQPIADAAGENLPGVTAVLHETAILTAEIRRFLTYSPQQQHEILEVLQGPNPVDESGRFDQMLQEISRFQSGVSWNPSILNFLSQDRPQWSKPITILKQAKSEMVDEAVLAMAQALPQWSSLQPVPAQPRPKAEMPRLLKGLDQAVLQEMEQTHGKDHRIEMRTIPGPKPGQTILLTIGGTNQPGVVAALTIDLGPDRTNINIDDLGKYDVNDSGFTYVVLDAPLSDLEKSLDQLQKRSVLQQIHRRLEILNQRGTEAQDIERLVEHLTEKRGRGRKPAEDVDWFTSLYWMYKQNPDLLIETETSKDYPGLEFLLAVFPYRKQPGVTTEVTAAVLPAINSAIQNTGNVGKVEQSFFTPFPEAPAIGQAGLLLIALPEGLIDRKQIGILNVVEEALRNYMPPEMAGAEELVQGIDYDPVAVNGVRFLRAVQISKPVRLSGAFGSIAIDPTKNGEIQKGIITIAPGVWLLDGARLEGPGVIDKAARVGGYESGSIEKPFIVGEGAEVVEPQANVKRSFIGPGSVIRGASLSDMTVGSFVRGSSVEKAMIGANTVAKNSVVFGGSLGTDVKLYEDGVVGPFVKMENNSEHAGSLLWGATKKAGINFLHHGFTETFWAFPIDWEGKLYSKEYYDSLERNLRAVVLGDLQSTELAEAAPVSDSGALFNASFSLDGSTLTVPVQRINFGAGTVTSDYNPMTGGRASGSASAGAATGVNSVPKLPVLLGPRALVANLSQASGEVSRGTIIVGSAQPGRVEGYRGNGYLLGGEIDQEVPVQQDYYRKLRITAKIYAEGARREKDFYTLPLWAASIRAVQRQFEGIEPRYARILTDGLPLSIQNISKRRAEAEASLPVLQEAKTHAKSTKVVDAQQKAIEEAEKEIRALDSRIKKQQQLLAQRDQILGEWKGIRAALQGAVDSVAAVTQPVVADWVIRKILQPEIAWMNPIATAPQAGAEETRILDRWNAIQAIVERGASGYTEVTVEGLTLPSFFLAGEQARNPVKVEHALGMISSGQMEVHFGGPAGNKMTVRPAAGLEEIGGPAIGVLPGVGIGVGRPLVIEKPVAVAEPVLKGTEAGAIRTIPADVARILESLGEFRNTTVETGVYGLIFAERAGLAVGVTLRFARDQDGKPLARRYVAANESQEQTLVNLGVARAEIVGAWEPEFKGDVNLAIAAAKTQLEASGAVVMEPIRGITATFAQLIQEIRNIETLLTPRDYSTESAAKIAQGIYDLFV